MSLLFELLWYALICMVFTSICNIVYNVFFADKQSEANNETPSKRKVILNASYTALLVSTGLIIVLLVITYILHVLRI
jgi:phosphotransferase system  glucose/maltose/N-acetylglucosamine-specific IIC component